MWYHRPGDNLFPKEMNSFDNYDRTTNLSEVCSSVMNLNDENENNDHFLWNMDTPVNKKDNSIYNSYEPKRKKCSLGEIEYVDGTDWCRKPIKTWCKQETISWLMSAASSIGLPYRSIQQSLAVSGEELAAMTRNDFLFHDPIYGDKLYCNLHSQRVSNSLPPFEAIHSHSEDDMAQMSSSGISDAESDNCMKITTKRPPGRPKILKTKKNVTGQGKLWEFIRDLLRNRETCPSLICWEDYSQAKFRFVKSDEVAKRWGSRKGNTKMTYEKLSRAMRYYYKSKIFQPVLGRRLVYQFGPNAKGWQTDNPNFRY
ncbi:ETS-related transcription factor Elf-5-like [Polistes fuscatus]|uniref:ETS-related transcription factor Elf-5-like n=1 Tax=Polistes fuscatus TaxID=30207 RepID=UPI001CA7CC99|nr:ETS-related transcription factor Elf-5-like [Polistes fuscatus]